MSTHHRLLFRSDFPQSEMKLLQWRRVRNPYPRLPLACVNRTLDGGMFGLEQVSYQELCVRVYVIVQRVIDDDNDISCIAL